MLLGGSGLCTIWFTIYVHVGDHLMLIKLIYLVETLLQKSSWNEINVCPLIILNNQILPPA